MPSAKPSTPASSGRNKPPRRSFRPPEDLGFRAGGIALAAATIVGAYRLVQDNDGTPRVNGVAHLALFAKPSGANPERATRGEEKREVAQVLFEGQEIDFEPTGAIAGAPRPARGAPAAKPAMRRWKVVEVRENGVLFDTATGPIFLRVGDWAPGHGEIRAIARRQERLVAVIGPPAVQTSR